MQRSYASSEKLLSGLNELAVYTHMNKPDGVSKEIYFKRFRLLRSDPESSESEGEVEDGKGYSKEDRRSLTEFPSTLVGCLNKTLDVYLMNLNWDSKAKACFTTQRAQDLTDSFATQIISHFKLKVHAGALDMKVRK
jgi:hypothetical protein